MKVQPGDMVWATLTIRRADGGNENILADAFVLIPFSRLSSLEPLEVLRRKVIDEIDAAQNAKAGSS